MHRKAFVALRSSKSSLSSLQQTFSGPCLNEKPDLKMGLHRKGSAFGRVSVIYLYFVVLHYIPAPRLSIFFFHLGEGWTSVYGKPLFWILLESLHRFY